jgi:hypothetical protein
MNTGHDPKLMALFEEAETKFDDAAFAEDIMRIIDGQRRKTMLVWSAAMLAGIACLSLVASPVVTALGMATELLPTSLVNIESDWLQKLLAPINSIAAALALGILAIRKFIRRIFD